MGGGVGAQDVGGGGGFGGGFGGGYGGSVPTTQGGGLGGFVNAPQSQAAGTPGGGRAKDSQSLMPVTIQMLLEAHERQKNSNSLGPDAPLCVNDREISMFTFVGTLESSQNQQMYRVFMVNDGTARIQVRLYNDGAATEGANEPVAGEYVRIFGTLRAWNNELMVSAHHVGRLENENEIPFHFIEVAYVHLSLTGKIAGKPAPPGPAFDTPGPQASLQGAQFGGAPQAPQFGGVQAQSTNPYGGFPSGGPSVGSPQVGQGFGYNAPGPFGGAGANVQTSRSPYGGPPMGGQQWPQDARPVDGNFQQQFMQNPGPTRAF